MIFHRALLREFAGLAGAVFMTLFAISLTTRLIRLLGQAAGGTIPSDAVIAFLGFFALGALPVLLSLTMFISVLLTLTRGWRDSEMVIWFGSGLPLTAWLRPVMMFALPQIAVIAVLSLFISPWAAQMGEQYQSRGQARDDVSRVSPGVFGETGSKDSSEPEMTPRNRSTWTLLANPSTQNLGELVWRVGVPLSALVLVLLAIPMSFVNPRAGRSANLLFALFTYIVYSNLLSVSQARVSQGRLDFGVGWWLVHAGMVLLLLFMFAQRMQLIRLRVGR